MKTFSIAFYSFASILFCAAFVTALFGITATGNPGLVPMAVLFGGGMLAGVIATVNVCLD